MQAKNDEDVSVLEDEVLFDERPSDDDGSIESDFEETDAVIGVNGVRHASNGMPQSAGQGPSHATSAVLAAADQQALLSGDLSSDAAVLQLAVRGCCCTLPYQHEDCSAHCKCPAVEAVSCDCSTTDSYAVDSICHAIGDVKVVWILHTDACTFACFSNMHCQQGVLC